MKFLPRVVCSIDGTTLPVQDYSFTSVANGGYHEFRGQAPLRNLLRLGADQEAPLTVYHEETGDILWDGRFVTDPEVIEGIGLISATGPKSELEKAHGRLLYQNRDVGKWFTRDSAPLHNLEADVLSVSVEGGRILWSEGQGSAATPGNAKSVAFWAQGSPGGITRVAFTHKAHYPGSRQYDVYKTDSFPADTGYTLIVSYGESSTDSARDTGVISAAQSGVLIQRQYTGGASTYSEGRAHIFDVRVNGIAPGDTFYGHEVLQDLGGRAGFNTSLIEFSGINVLPLDWIGSSWAALADYIVSLEDWRWLISTIAEPGTGLVQYLEAGPFEQEWTLFKGSRANPRLAPLQRRNEGVVSYRDVSGADLEVRVRADPDPLAMWGVVRTVEASLPDVQGDDVLATALATTLAQANARMRWVGDIDAADARDDSGRGDARLVKPGDIGRLADWGPSEETFHRIHGTEQTQTTVRYSIESPISAAPLIEGAALERARRPSEAELPELELPEPQILTLEDFDLEPGGYILAGPTEGPITKRAFPKKKKKRRR